MKTVTLNVEQRFFDNGQIAIESYRLNDLLHNENGPAFIKWFKGGRLNYVYYCINGKIHNEKGPAFVSGDSTEAYFLDGKQYSKEEWERKLNICNPAGKTVVIDGQTYKLEKV